jgi:hypothetical protein
MFSFYKSHNNDLYNKLVILSRNIFFYKTTNFKDSFETRITLIFVHFALILVCFKNKNKEKFPQEIFDNIFLNVEYHLREMGMGDVTVNKQMKFLTKIFYDILLKINSGDKKSFKLNSILLKKYFDIKGQINDQKIVLLSKYLTNFYNFCFELSLIDVLKGDITFKN